jgi:diaminopimelate decarboxylase
MDEFAYRAGALHCEALPAAELAARFGTPLYVYSQRTFIEHYARLRSAFAALDPLVCFSVKCCQNLHILDLLRREGSGFDVVSGGELYRALRAGADPQKVVYAGVGKTEPEVRAAFAAGIGLLNCESESELAQLAELAQQCGARPRIALRVNPDVDPRTHVYTTTGKRETKFGVDFERALEVFRKFGVHKHLQLAALHMHIGSPVNDVAPYERAVRRGLELVDALRAAGFHIDTLDLGGGFGAHYTGSEAPPAVEYARTIVPLLAGRGLRIILEPGRSIAANAGIILTRVLHVKQSGSKRFVIVDAAMTELVRPALYGAYHFIWPVAAAGCEPPTRAHEQPLAGLERCDVVGPVCESGDFLGKDRPLPPLKSGDLLAIFSAGAYAMTMSSQYNSRPRAAEVLVAGEAARLIRRRETYEDLVRLEAEAGA